MINKFDGRYRFLSNFYPSEIEYQGIKYPTNEHYYVAMKINDPQFFKGIGNLNVNEAREYISTIETAGQVKRVGRLLSVRKDWDSVKIKVMEYGVRQKFTKHSNLKEMLLSTDSQELVEGNTWHDNFFGSCECDKCGDKGLNHLGKILMMVRDSIKKV